MKDICKLACAIRPIKEANEDAILKKGKRANFLERACHALCKRIHHREIVAHEIEREGILRFAARFDVLTIERFG